MAKYAKVIEPCPICEDGSACSCTIRLRLHPLPLDSEPIICACMGFGGCPACGLTAAEKYRRLGFKVIEVG